MRKSRQPRCTAANSILGAAKAPKPLEAGGNFAPAEMRRVIAGAAMSTAPRAKWHQVKQVMPEA
jgi:hypothetical protein